MYVTPSPLQDPLPDPQTRPPNEPPTRKYPLLPTIFVVLVVVAVVFTGSLLLYPRFLPSTPLTPSSPLATPSADSLSRVSEAHDAFGFAAFKLLNQDSDENVFISPTSIAFALSMTLNGAQGETKSAIAKTLFLDRLDLGEINASHALLLQTLSNPDPKVTLSIANSIWTREGMDFSPTFLQTTKDFYRAEVASLDFTAPQSVKTVNDWVSKNTNGKIPTIIDSIPPEMVMYLLNAVYFNGTWTYEFDKKLTEDRDFTGADGTSSQHPFMKQTKEFPYFENDQFAGVLLPYGENQRLGMYVLLPKDDFNSFLEELTADNWKSWISNFTKREGTLLLPKFKLEYETSLNDILKNLGMKVAFDPTNADFTKMLARPIPENLFISEVKHKTFIDVKEEGTEAAAVTSVGIDATSVGPDNTFYLEVNRPFVLAIADTKTGEILFLGAIRNPGN
ncbi:serpin family protein [Candidatus Gottesmanbacteria bacterium]|nr:serpin family protein [Candidatus Gottesmanbacteria bacterium]